MRGIAATLAAGGLLALFGWMAASVSREHCTTADEINYVTAGYSYWQLGDYRLPPEAGNLPQRWAALPLLWQDLRFPRLDQPAWHDADVGLLGQQFFYASGNDSARMLAAARAMIALLGVAGGVIVFLWSRSLFGLRGALVSTALFTFCPNLLAHAGLATSDMAATLGFLAALLAGWRLLHRVTVGRALAAGAAFALLALSKFSAPLLGPVLAALGLVRAWRGPALPVRVGRLRARLRGGRAALALAGALAAALLVAWGLIWSAYGFRYAALRGPGQFNVPWEVVLRPGAWAPDLAAATAATPDAVQRTVATLRAGHVLPEAWLYGLATVNHFSHYRIAYFLGEVRTTGWVAFFPVAFLLKTPLPALALLAGAGLCLVAGPRSRARGRLLYRLAPLGVFGLVYAGFALSSHLNLGLRHLLPLYPVLYIAAGAVALAWHRRGLALAVAALLGWHAAASLAIRPSYLAYFNPLRGGPARGYEAFVDSSLDWGQDLPGLKRWLDTHARGERVFLSYFGSGSLVTEGITATRLADGDFDREQREVAPAMTGGVYCLSATQFQQIYTLVRHGWSPVHEQRYQELRRWAEAWLADLDPTPRDAALPLMVELEHLRFGRLGAALHHRRPDAEVGYSILIFRLSDADVRAALEGPPPSLP